MNTSPVTLSDWLTYIEQQHPLAIAMRLERLRAVAARMGLTRPAKRVITVGGTNGKGSTVAFIESIARAGGWAVGSYTSPHLLRYNERVRIGGEEASDAQLIAGFVAVEAARGDTPLTYFEYSTLVALWLFEQSGLDLAVLEVGLGGRLDAVNVVDADVAVITTVDIDHTEWLGSDREAIGTEKVGIARPWKPLVLGEIDPPSSVLRHAYAIGASVLRAGSDFFHEPLDAERWRWRDVGTELSLPLPQLRASVQLANAATAIAALRALRKSLPRSAYAEGIAAARLGGRLQSCMRDGVEVLVDVGHNPQAARVLAASLQAQPVVGATRVVFAALGDKDAVGVVKALEGQVDAWHLAGLSGVRGQSGVQLRERLAGTAAAVAVVAENVVQALQQALQQARPGDRVLVFGSFHTAADALHWLHSAG
ncbi:bifunctional tetrahydrofolate synthase/dihydrofolate synthase [Xanthomonas albilineans]|uniref:bifunctional tetrahydrofolate synthase/dihydrofolate synthase n=1 Tax=Xanthomonas albilineans TaxID=29447 RepID=UPI0005F321A3|nr:bifunctional tetrahydrofolate synthase/dihydrofolate synthase [Xanthomonas albilineans]PPU92961.1 bifunctional tetrahydrofolate synthase/dihydrofolate synthase [Xanthomonas albilineans]